MEQNLPPLPQVTFENGLYYELRGEQYYPCLLPPEPDTTEDKLLETIIRQMAADFQHGLDLGNVHNVGVIREHHLIHGLQLSLRH